MYLDTQKRQAGASTQQQASRVHTVSKLRSLGNSLAKVLADFDLVDSRYSIRETCADPDRETIVSTESREREIETKTLCRPCLSTVKISIKSLSGKLNWPSEERKCLSRNCMKLRQTWRWNIGKSEIQVCGSSWGQSGVRISTISTTTSESVGRSGSKR